MNINLGNAEHLLNFFLFKVCYTIIVNILCKKDFFIFWISTNYNTVIKKLYLYSYMTI